MYENFRKSDPKCKTKVGDETFTDYEIGRWVIRVAEDGSVQYRSNRYASNDPRRLLPSLELDDDRLVIHIEDFVPMILEHTPPAELARTMWSSSEEVKRSFIDNFIEWYESGFSDEDRRAFLKRVKEAIHDKALDDLINLLSEGEYNFSKHFYLHEHISRINRLLRSVDLRDREGRLVQIENEAQDPRYRIGGEAWNEARAHWRLKVREHMGWEDE